MFVSTMLAAAIQSTLVGSFTIMSQVDPISDKPQVMAALQDGDNALAFRCEEPQSGRIAVIFATNSYLRQKTPLFSPSLTIRFGKSDPEIAYWNFEDQKAFIRERKPVSTFIAKVIRSEKIVIRAEAIDGRNNDAVFDILEAKKAIGLVAAACGDREIVELLSR